MDEPRFCHVEDVNCRTVARRVSAGYRALPVGFPMAFLKSLIKGTPIEAPTRFVYRALTGRGGAKPRKSGQATEWKEREQRDTANIERVLHAALTETSNCLDVGANEGVFLRQFLHFAPRGHHHAFEPIAPLAVKLKENFPTVDVRQCALGAATGRANFCFVPTRPAWSGLRTQPYPEPVQPQEIEVEIFRLDDLLPADWRVDFIKIDVEGAELEVLEGAVETIKRTRSQILFEHARIHNTSYATTPADIHALLSERCGLQLYCLDGTGPLTSEALTAIYDRSHASGYDRFAQTNFLARPG